MSSQASTSGRLEHLWILAIALLVVAGALLLSPSPEGCGQLSISLANVRIDLPRMCFWSKVVGISCPGCGLTRSFVHCARGELWAAAKWNLMGPVLFLVVLLQIPYRFIEFTGMWEPSPRWNRIKHWWESILWFIVAGLICAWIVKVWIQ